VRRSGLRAAFCALAATIAVGLAPARAQPPMWIVRSPQATLVLFGSVHLLPAGLDWRPPAFNDALAKADELWFELPIDSESDNQAAAEAMTRGVLPKDRRLSAMLSAVDIERLNVAAAELNCAPAALDRMQPWMADLTLSVADDAKAGASATDGVESQVQAATPATVRRRAFETAREQIEFLAGTPLHDQIASLGWTLREIEEDPLSYQRVVREWMSGDLAGLERDAVDPLRQISPRLYERLIGQRNRKWAVTLGQRLKAPGSIVVVVGVGHLIGPKGLPALLRAEGFEVEGPSEK
jgi:uncharacterized protein YbaP (TraB family)